MWYLVIITLLLVGIALAVTKLKPFLRWIRSKEGQLIIIKIMKLITLHHYVNTGSTLSIVHLSLSCYSVLKYCLDFNT